MRDLCKIVHTVKKCKKKLALFLFLSTICPERAHADGHSFLEKLMTGRDKAIQTAVAKFEKKFSSSVKSKAKKTKKTASRKASTTTKAVKVQKRVKATSRRKAA